MPNLRFINFAHNNKEVSADMYVDDQYIFRLSDSIPNVVNPKIDISNHLYHCFREAMVSYLLLQDNHSISNQIH